MPRFVICVHDDSRPAPYMAVVEADTPLAALYQYPEYQRMFKADYFLGFGTVEAWAANYPDQVCVRDLNEMLGSFLST